MIFFKPDNNNNNENVRILALDGETDIGSCTVRVNGYECVLSDIYVETDDSLVIEGLIRSALNYAANRNAYTAVCRDEKYSDVLKLLGFEKIGGSYSGEIPELLKGSCCKN